MSQRVLKYRGPKNGQAYIRTKRLNGGREVYLGKYDSRQSRRQYAHYLSLLSAPLDQAAQPLPNVADECRLVVELINLYLDELRPRMTTGGTVKKEYRNIGQALVNLDKSAGDLLVNAIEPAHLETLQRELASEGLSRKLINKRITIIKRFFRWCSSNSKRTGTRKTLYHELLVVKGLQPGEFDVREAPKIRPVPLVIVEKTLPWLSPVVACMVRVQLLCGMRPGEVCRLTTGDVDTSGAVWVYRPAEHKNAWRSQERMIAIPHAAQAFLRPFLQMDDPDGYVFTPAASEAARHARGTGRRKTKVYPSELKARARRKAARRHGGPLRFNERYTAESYWRAVQHAIQRAGVAGVHIPPWHPQRLRHSSRKAVSGVLGQQAAMRWLGHENLATTDLYTALELEELEVVANSMEEHWNQTVFARTPGILNPELNTISPNELAGRG